MPEVDYENENENDCDGYLYDVENDKLFSFIKNYEKDINQRFNIYKQHSNNVNSSRKVFKSYVIDNENHIMYWYVCVDIKQNNQNIPGPEPYSMIIAFDMKNLTSIQLLYQKMVTNNEISQFSRKEHIYKMVMIENNRIELVLGGVNGWSHYQFNTITQQLELIDNCILSKNINHVTYQKISNCFENLAIGDWIDSQYFRGIGNFLLSQIADIKDKKFNDFNQLISMKLKLDYYGWMGKKEDKWIDVFNSIDKDKDKDKDYGKDDDNNNNVTGDELLLTSLCDCNGKCNQKNHHIALPKCQSYFGKYPTGWSAIYSKSEKKLLVFGLGTNLNWSVCIGNKKFIN